MTNKKYDKLISIILKNSTRMLFNQQPSQGQKPEVVEVEIDRELMEKGLETLYAKKQFLIDEIKSVEGGLYTTKNDAVSNISNSRYLQNLKKEFGEVQAVIDFKQQHRNNNTQVEYLGGNMNFPILPEEENAVMESLPKKTLRNLGIVELEKLLTILTQERKDLEKDSEEYRMNMEEYSKITVVLNEKNAADSHNRKITGGGGLWAGRGKRPLR